MVGWTASMLQTEIPEEHDFQLAFLRGCPPPPSPAPSAPLGRKALRTPTMRMSARSSKNGDPTRLVVLGMPGVGKSGEL